MEAPPAHDFDEPSEARADLAADAQGAEHEHAADDSDSDEDAFLNRAATFVSDARRKRSGAPAPAPALMESQSVPLL